MNFAGIQKLTLLDYPDKTACTLFSAGCNFACPFCHNPELIGCTQGDSLCFLPEQEVLDFLQSRLGFIEAVCISGGEPLINKDIIEFTDKVKQMGYMIKTDTNGSNPKLLRQLVQSGRIDYVAMDVKNTLDKYPQTIGVPGFDTNNVKESIEFLLSGVVDYEFRTTVVRQFHTADDLAAIAKMLHGAGKYFLQIFENPHLALQPGLSSYSKDEMQEILHIVCEILPNTQLRG